MAPLAQQMQPPPLTPIQLLGTDYLSGATLHQVMSDIRRDNISKEMI